MKPFPFADERGQQILVANERFTQPLAISEQQHRVVKEEGELLKHWRQFPVRRIQKPLEQREHRIGGWGGGQKRKERLEDFLGKCAAKTSQDVFCRVSVEEARVRRKLNGVGWKWGGHV